MRPCIITGDIGNTSATFGLGIDGGIQAIQRMPTHGHISAASIIAELTTWKTSLSQMTDQPISAAMLCSVVPDVTALFAQACTAVFNVTTHILGQTCPVGIINHYEPPDDVGFDRLANAIAVKAQGKVPAIIIDFGTAITIDVVAADGSYEGGLIIPGVRLSLDSLYEKTALLPKIDLQEPLGMIGHTTADSLRSGVINGFSALCEGVIARLTAEIDVRPTVIATGGDAATMAPHIPAITAIDETLTLSGLYARYLSLIQDNHN